MSSTGTLFTVSAPSGAGKTSLVNALIKHDAGVAGIRVPYHPPQAAGRDRRGRLPLY